MTEKLVEQLRSRGVEVVHVGQFDYSGMFRERRLGIQQFTEWARNPRFANTLAKWDGADELFTGGPHLTERLLIDETSLRTYSHEPNAALLVADFRDESAELMPSHDLARAGRSRGGHGLRRPRGVRVRGEFPR